MKTRIALLTSALFTLWLAAPAAMAQPDPGDVARACLQRIQRITESGVREMAHECRRTVAIVEELVAQGRIELAQEAAARGARIVTRTAHATVGEVRMTARVCLHALDRLGADPELLRIVANAAQRAQRLIGGVRNHCLRAIQTALEG